METHYNNCRDSAVRCVATIGMFDGVHCGHVSLLGQLKKKAQEMQLPSAVVTFWPHPKLVVGAANNELKVLSSLAEKLSLLESHGIDHVFVVDFTADFAQLSPQDFIRDYLLARFGVCHLLMGYNHHFGSGSYQLADYERFAAESGLSCSRFSQFRLAGEAECSSSEVRRYLQTGEVAGAAKILGYSYQLVGKVVRGDGYGRQIGFRTANIVPLEERKMLPADGVYAAWCDVSGENHKAVVDVGYRPTVFGNQHRIEVHIMNFEADIYNFEIRVTFVARIRNELRFSDVEELKATISADVEKADKMLQNVQQ